MEKEALLLNEQAIDLSNRGNYKEAIACFLSAIHIEKNNFLLWYNLGITYRDSGDLEAAKNALFQAHKLDSSNEEVLETLSLVCYTAEDLGEAFYWARQALDINPRNANVWNNIGVYHFAENDFTAAAAAFERALSIYPHYYDALFNLKDAYLELGNRVGAKECEAKMRQISAKRKM
jgi:tetratricopeptide (TPR) repeat protein